MRRAPDVCRRMAADKDRDVAFDGLGKTLQRSEVEMLAVEGRRIFTPNNAQRLDYFVGSAAARLPIDTQRIELLLEPSRTDAENHAPARQHIQRSQLLANLQRMVQRQDYDHGAELKPLG